MPPRRKSSSPARQPLEAAPAAAESRDELGLSKAPAKTEAEARKFYFNMLGKLTFLQAPALAWAIYFVYGRAFGGHALMDAKFGLLNKYGLGWCYVACFMAHLTRTYLVLNVNGARAPARVDRPDQHVYRIMASSGPLADAPYVLMATDGAAGRFNRAQRAVCNTDETLPPFLVSTLLAGVVFGPAIVPLCLLHMYGRITFANLYTESLEARGAGFLPSVVAEHVMAGLVGVAAIKTILYGVLPF